MPDVTQQLREKGRVNDTPGPLRVANNKPPWMSSVASAASTFCATRCSGFACETVVSSCFKGLVRQTHLVISHDVLRLNHSNKGEDLEVLEQLLVRGPKEEL